MSLCWAKAYMTSNVIEGTRNTNFINLISDVEWKKQLNDNNRLDLSATCRGLIGILIPAL